MNAIVAELNSQKLSPTESARIVAARLEQIGCHPYYSDRERYLLLLEDRPGDVVEMGRPLRSSRLFKRSVLARDIRMVRDIESFAAACHNEEWLFWNISLTGAKASVGGLVEANREFSRLINIHFSELRRRNEFELILLVIHPRFDQLTGRFDLHAHIVCRIPPAHREAARRRLMTAFSRAHVPDDAVRSAGACATYMAWGICPPEEIIGLPDEALSDLWRLSRSKARLLRTGDRFAQWRRAARAAEEAERRKLGLSKEKRRRGNPLPEPDGHDRLLAKVKATVNGKKVVAMLFERRSTMSDGVARSIDSAPAPLADSSSATSDIAQDSATGTVTDFSETSEAPRMEALTQAEERGRNEGMRARTRKMIRDCADALARVCSASTTWIRESVHRVLSRCRGSPR